MSSTRHSALPDGVDVFERGWLSANNILLHGTSADEGAVLIDTGYATHAPQTLALVDAALRPGEALRRIANTHLHSDHCGGNAALVARHGCRVEIPPGDLDAVASWNEERLSYRATGQNCPRFRADALLRPGEELRHGGLMWEIHAAAGHDPHSILFFEPRSRTLISADALWEKGFGIVFPELDGDAAFDEVEATLDLIETLKPSVVIPGHGAVFYDADQALAIARQKLDHFRRDPARHGLHGAKALTVFHLLEIEHATRSDLIAWLVATPVLSGTWQRFFAADPIGAWSEQLVDSLVRSGVLFEEPRPDGVHIRLGPIGRSV